MADSSEATPESQRTVWPLGKYVVLAELGRGGMAEVFLALARGPNGFHKQVVLKLLRAHLAEDAEFLDMFLGEARLAARLNHPNVVQTYEVGVEGGRHCIVMEYLEGRSFSEVEVSTRHSGLPLALGIRVLADTLAGLHHAHELSDLDGRTLGLVHRDISPHNVMVTYDGQVKVLDFGIAKAADDQGRTRTGVFKGKLRYTAPERFGGEDVDRRSDVFSVGVMLWQLLTGKRAWSKMSDMSIMQQLASGTVLPPPRTVVPSVSPLLDAICVKAMAPRASDRYQSAAELGDALEDYLASETQGTSRALGKFMTEHFGEQRALFQRTVDEQTRRASLMPPAEETASVARIRAEERIPVLGSPASSSLSLRGSVAPDSISSSQSSRVRASSLPASAPPAVNSAGPRPQANRGMFLAIALIAFALIALVAVVAVRSNDGAASAAARGGAPAPASAETTPLAPPPPAVAPAPPSAASSPSAALAPVVLPSPPPAKHNVAAAPAPRAAPPSHGKAAPAPAETRPAATPSPRDSKPEPDCSSPYYIDEQGLKKIRSECL